MHENEDIPKSLWQDDQELMIEDEEQSRVKQSYIWLKIKGKDHRCCCKWGLKTEDLQKLGVNFKKGIWVCKAQPKFQDAWWCKLDEQMV